MSHLFKLPTLQPYSGDTNFAYVNPLQVCALEVEEIDVGDDRSSTTITGTRVVTAQEIYFVPLPLDHVADVLQFTLHDLAKEVAA